MLVRWRATQSQLQKLGSTGISRSLATSPSGKKPNRPSSNVPRKIEDPPPRGGVGDTLLLKFACLSIQRLIRAWITDLSLPENEQEPQGKRAGVPLTLPVF